MTKCPGVTKGFGMPKVLVVGDWVEESYEIGWIGLSR